ncbi:TorF family putative porin [Roseobacter litoralis]|uniref:TorF family putative porin n=1 Tax=Roseobacter litoralis TaxID=42443 RepID=UPI0024941220|nr:TorF family putative porin [Roseobacter litoralis]
MIGYFGNIIKLAEENTDCRPALCFGTKPHLVLMPHEQGTETGCDIARRRDCQAPQQPYARKHRTAPRFFALLARSDMETNPSGQTRGTLKRINELVVFGVIVSLAVLFGNKAVDAEPFEFSYGVDITSDYISKGSTQTDGRAAVQPYVELSNGIFYFGLWASNVRFDGVSDVELDIYAGITPSWGQVEFDIGFARYLYRDDDTNYGEAIIKASYAINETVRIGADYYREVYADEDWFYVNGAVSDLPWDLTLSAGLGTDFGSKDLPKDKYASDIGLTKDLSDFSAIDLRFYGSNSDDEVLVLTMSFFY